MMGMYGPTVRRTLPWRGLGQAQALTDGHLNAVTIEPEVVPIVFVPGIMGTRLTSVRGMVWDPDDVVGFCINFGLRFSDLPSRMQALLGARGYHPHHLWLPHRGSAFEAGPSWSNLVQSTYGKLMRSLQQAQPSPAMRLCLHMPPYAFAYNWTQSPEQSGKTLKLFIERIIAKHRGDHVCDKVLLITHSMGGLVARAAMHLHGAEEQVLGVVHAMMPTAGAPDLYLRMKRGFVPPPVTSAVSHAAEFAEGSMFAALMGATGSGVAQVLGHMPGALSLLPSHLYHNRAAASAWLTLQERLDGPSIDHLPRASDPYDEVYRLQHGPARLYDVPPNCPHDHVPCQEPSCWHEVQVAIDDVEHVHRRLGHRFHSNSHHIVGTQVPTPTRARFFTRHEGESGHASRLDGAAPSTRGARAAVGLSGVVDAYDIGDGTVPLSSALSGLEDAGQYTLVAGVEHSMAMAAPEVLTLMHARIRAMAHSYIAAGLQAGAR